MNMHRYLIVLVTCIAVFFAIMHPAFGRTFINHDGDAVKERREKKITSQQRLGAAGRAASSRKQGTENRIQAMSAPGTPDYFNVPNYTNSPILRKFIDGLPGLGPDHHNNLGQFIPVAVPDTTTYPGSDYYEIALVEYTEKMHSDLPGTRLRGYVQTNGPISVPHYMGPLIIAQSGVPVRVKFTNKLPTGAGGDLFLPVDTTMMGAGTGPLSWSWDDMMQMFMPNGNTETYTQNRATLHLHGGFTPWISDGTPHQWITPAGENTSYPKGVSVHNVPDMPDPGDGSETFYYTNQQSARLMFYHDHAYGITRLNVYAGEAAGYIVTDPVEQQLVTDGVIPADQIPLIIQDKTFVPDNAKLAQTDPLWDSMAWGGMGSLWFPHVYMPNQNPNDPAGVNAFGRWDYGPWIWPPTTVTNNTLPWPSSVMESFMDTPVVNGTAYPVLKVEKKAYRFRVLNACNDRFLNLQLYYAKSNNAMWDASGNLIDADAGEVAMVPAPDGRDGGIPDVTKAGPMMVQIGTEGGLLPNAVHLNAPPVPVGWDNNRKSMTFGNVKNYNLLMGPAERADLIVDFSQMPAGSKLILYNDAPAALPAGDPRYDYYTGDPDLTAEGGAPSTQPGYGPNTRTIMQIEVVDTLNPAPAFDVNALDTAIPTAYAATQDPPLIPEMAYNQAFPGVATKNNYARIFDGAMTFTPAGSTGEVTIPFQTKAIVEEFDATYGRMNTMLGTEWWIINNQGQQTNGFAYIDPATETVPEGETQIWKIVHNGVDTHAIHWHLVNVQVINRVDWAGVVKPPDPNELGWKETVRMHPLEDCIIAVRAKKPEVPFEVPNSIRPLDPTMPLGSTMGFTQPFPSLTDPNGTTTVNRMENFGFEYVWHCHLLGHEEMDMMRPLVMTPTVAPSAPAAPTNLVANAISPTRVDLSWTDNASNEDNFTLQRADDAGFTTGVTTVSVHANVTTYSDTTVLPNTTYYYRVLAGNLVGASAWSNTAMVLTPSPLLAAPSGLTATAISPTRVDLAWTDNTATETGFTVQRSADTGFATGVTTFTVGANVTVYSDTSAGPNTTYYYRVQAVNAAGVSGWSNTATAVTPVAVPAAPSGLTATAVSLTLVDLTWTDNAGNETGFTIERATDNGFTANRASFTVGANTTTYSDTTAQPKTTYYYRVQANNATGASGWSNTATVTTPYLPAAPSGLAAAASSPTQVALSWVDNADNEIGFTIERATGNGAFAFLATVGANSAAYTDATAQPKTAYAYRVQASNAYGVSGWSNTATTTTPYLPAAPANLGATVVTAYRVNLAWTDAADNETGFRIERATGAGAFAPLATVAANTATYGDTTAQPATTYRYRVFAYNTYGDSPASNSATATTPDVPPAAPSGFTAVPSTLSVNLPTVSLHWTDNANNETGFTLQRATNTGFTTGLTTVALGANVMLYTDTGVTTRTTYYYRLRAGNAVGNSTWVTASAVTPGRLPATPTNLLVSTTLRTAIRIAWTDNANNETGFYIERSTAGANGPWSRITTVGANTTSYWSSGLINRTYWYRVQAYNADGVSAYTNVVSYKL